MIEGEKKTRTFYFVKPDYIEYIPLNGTLLSKAKKRPIYVFRKRFFKNDTQDIQSIFPNNRNFNFCILSRINRLCQISTPHSNLSLMGS